MRIGVRRGPRAADEHQRKHTGRPDSSGRPWSRRVGLTYGCSRVLKPKAASLMSRRVISNSRASIFPFTHAFIKRHCTAAKGHQT